MKKIGLRSLRMTVGVLILMFIAGYAGFLFGFNHCAEVMGCEVTTCISPSMEPVIMTNGLVVTDHSVPVEEIKVGDTILFTQGFIDRAIQHEVIEIDYSMGSPAFKTQGINNPAPDKEWVFEENYLGKVVGNSNASVLGVSFLNGDIYNNNATSRIVFGVIGLLGVIGSAFYLVLKEFIDLVFKALEEKKYGRVLGIILIGLFVLSVIIGYSLLALSLV